MVVVWGMDWCNHRRHHCLEHPHAELFHLILRFFHLSSRFLSVSSHSLLKLIFRFFHLSLRFLSVSSHFYSHEGNQGLCIYTVRPSAGVGRTSGSLPLLSSLTPSAITALLEAPTWIATCFPNAVSVAVVDFQFSLL